MPKFSFPFRKHALLATFALELLSLSPAAAGDAASQCRRARQANEKLQFCSQAIAQTNDPTMLERLYLRRGNAFMELKLFAEAKKDFTSLIAINPGVAGYFDNRMSASRELGQMHDALVDANREVALAPNTSFVHRSRGLLFEQMMDYQRALQDFEQAAAIDPANVGLVIDRARLKSKLGRGLEAIQDLDGAIAREPANLWAYRERGLAYVLIGDTANAEQDLALYSRTAPDDEEVRSTLAIIRARQGTAVPAGGPGPN